MEVSTDAVLILHTGERCCNRNMCASSKLTANLDGNCTMEMILLILENVEPQNL
ncbi:hypothetical protein SLEP1_g5125 [Rubroshorea leprosula]|uniref:Uncharacterized protein n=1 Tax=Rubroshorea leprosula TaxID=152421 RepID=A0AAV5HVA4_9ROSI|nr:hypothetical protein SLEP1_g5125 [Rubroshorea leprosula]